MRSVLRAILLAVVLASTLPAVSVSAQDPSPSEVSLARRLYREGLRHARGGRWEEARAAFERSLDLAPRPATRLNLGTAQLETGHLVAAAESYRHYLAETTSERHRARAQGLLDELEPRIPTLLLTIENLAGDDTVQLDDQDLSAVAIGEPLPVDPGEHSITVLRAGSEIAAQDVTLAEGERSEVSLRVPPPPPPTPREVAERAGAENGGTTADDDGFVGSTTFWIVTGAAAVAIGVVVILLATSGGETYGPHYEGNLGSAAVP